MHCCCPYAVAARVIKLPACFCYLCDVVTRALLLYVRCYCLRAMVACAMLLLVELSLARCCSSAARSFAVMTFVVEYHCYMIYVVVTG